MNNKKSIMIVDDEKMVILALTQILSPDYTLYVVKDGREAVRIATQFAPDLIFLDIVMPDITGYEVLEQLKADEATSHIPVILVSGLDNENDRSKGFSLGACDYITKPFNSKIIRERLTHHLHDGSFT
ncbi:MAG: response regulator [Lachnospiraceae bacterium]|nr:response regulator [Lachnospiraceae bacterium]